ncbi:MAG: hypothetical protein ACREBC_20030, partial [Pyrinomonadaceae bacterium]
MNRWIACATERGTDKFAATAKRGLICAYFRPCAPHSGADKQQAYPFCYCQEHVALRVPQRVSFPQKLADHLRAFSTARPLLIHRVITARVRHQGALHPQQIRG